MSLGRGIKKKGRGNKRKKWFARKDSNLDFQGQNLTCCHCTTGEQGHRAFEGGDLSTQAHAHQLSASCPPSGRFAVRNSAAAPCLPLQPFGIPRPIAPKNRPPVRPSLQTTSARRHSNSTDFPPKLNQIPHHARVAQLFVVAPSSSGLGRWPLTPETWVRVPLGSPLISLVSLLFLEVLCLNSQRPTRQLRNRQRPTPTALSISKSGSPECFATA